MLCPRTKAFAILPDVTECELEIVPCPAALYAEALALVLRELTPELRGDIVSPDLIRKPASTQLFEALFIARQGGRVVAATWGQLQPGNTAVFWPPQAAREIDSGAATRLMGAAMERLDALGVSLVQVLLPNREATIVPALEAIGFTHLADLLYLSWEAVPLPTVSSAPLDFEPFRDSQRARLVDVIGRTYLKTQDCAAMNGKRSMDDVVDGYQRTGSYEPVRWMFVRANGADVGVLLLTEHSSARHWELLYMGLVPEARGHRWGTKILRRAQAAASQAGAERLVLAVDSVNLPALVMYRDAGFVVWDKRVVYVRFH